MQVVRGRLGARHPESPWVSTRLWTRPDRESLAFPLKTWLARKGLISPSPHECLGRLGWQQSSSSSFEPAATPLHRVRMTRRVRPAPLSPLATVARLHDAS